MLKLLAAALLALAGASGWMALPRHDAAEANRDAARMCAEARSRLVPGAMPPAVCLRTPEPEGPATEWLTIAAILAAGGIIVLALTQRRTG